MALQLHRAWEQDHIWKGSLGRLRTTHKTGPWLWFLHSLCSEPKACARKHEKKYFISLTVYNLLKYDPESINVAILVSLATRGHRLKGWVLENVEQCLKAISITVQVTRFGNLFMCAFLLCDHPTIIYLVKLWKIIYCPAKCFNLVLYQKTIAKVF